MYYLISITFVLNYYYWLIYIYIYVSGVRTKQHVLGVRAKEHARASAHRSRRPSWLRTILVARNVSCVQHINMKANNFTQSRRILLLK